MEHEKKSKFSKDKFVWQFEMATVTALQALIMLSVFVATVIVFVLFRNGSSKFFQKKKYSDSHQKHFVFLYRNSTISGTYNSICTVSVI